MLLDGAAFNAPVFDDGVDRPDIPDKPDLKTQPIEYMRWFHTYSPGIPAHLRKNKEEIESICARFQADIDAGKRVWIDRAKNWVDPAEW